MANMFAKRRFKYGPQLLLLRRRRRIANMSIRPPSSISGASYVTVGTPDLDAPDRIVTSPDLQSGWVIAWGNIVGSGTVVINSDGTFNADEDVLAFQVQVWDGSSWGAVAWQFFVDSTISDPSNQSQTGLGLSDAITFTPFTPVGGEIGAISIDVGEYSLNGGAYTSAAGIWNGEEITVRHTSSGSFNTAVVSTLSVADQAVTFSSTTAPALAFSVQPVAANLGATSVRVQFTAAGHNDITYGIAVVADGAAVPTTTDILAGTVSGAVAELIGQIAANGVVELSSVLSGLSVGTPYDIYVAIDDAESAAVRSNRVDITTPEESGYSPVLFSGIEVTRRIFSKPIRRVITPWRKTRF